MYSFSDLPWEPYNSKCGTDATGVDTASSTSLQNTRSSTLALIHTPSYVFSMSQIVFCTVQRKNRTKQKTKERQNRNKKRICLATRSTTTRRPHDQNKLGTTATITLELHHENKAKFPPSIDYIGNLSHSILSFMLTAQSSTDTSWKVKKRIVAICYMKCPFLYKCKLFYSGTN